MTTETLTAQIQALTAIVCRTPADIADKANRIETLKAKIERIEDAEAWDEQTWHGQIAA